MASLYEDKDGWRIQFPAIDGSDDRSSIRLGRIRKRNAENVNLRVERLIEAKETGNTNARVYRPDQHVTLGISR